MRELGRALVFLAAGLTLWLAAALMAEAQEYEVYALGARYYVVIMAPVTVPTPSGSYDVVIRVPLDDVPGGPDGEPWPTVTGPVTQKEGRWRLENRGYYPVPWPYAAGVTIPYVGYTLHADPGQPGAYQVRVTIRGAW